MRDTLFDKNNWFTESIGRVLVRLTPEDRLILLSLYDKQFGYAATMLQKVHKMYYFNNLNL